jgi:hypothetical protein
LAECKITGVRITWFKAKGAMSSHAFNIARRAAQARFIGLIAMGPFQLGVYSGGSSVESDARALRIGE